MSGPAFDWAELMRLGIGRLGLRPAEFWALTPAELLVMLGAGERPAPLDRAGLAALIARFPDVRRGEADERLRGSERAGGGAGSQP